SAVLEADRDLSIRSAVLNNMGKDYDSAPGGDYGYNVYNQDGPGYGWYYWDVIWQEAAYSTLNTQPSYLSAGRNLSVTGAAILNHSSVISAGQDITFNQGSLNNYTALVNTRDLYRLLGQHTIYNSCNALGGD